MLYSFHCPAPALRAYFFTRLGPSTLPVFPHNFLASFLKRDFNPTVYAEISRIEGGGKRSANDAVTTIRSSISSIHRFYDRYDQNVFVRSLDAKIPSFYFYRGIFKAFIVRAFFLFGEEKKSKVKERKEYRQRVRCIEYFRCNLSPSPLPNNQYSTNVRMLKIHSATDFHEMEISD